MGEGKEPFGGLGCNAATKRPMNKINNADDDQDDAQKQMAEWMDGWKTA